ncbi:MAG: DUF58 domain-containing protein [Opitutales bacterium TMED158]|nr:MAG: DUF58 domain-containing protein [Opitutales bacterium TMED158]
MPTASTGIDPQALFAIRDLELRARVIVEGLWSGLHRSPLEGFSVEFTEYRQYTQGDDLRYLDWKALARTDREYIKKFEDETNLRCLLLVDSSRSMKFGSGDAPKAEYARTLAATFAYFLLQQRDIVGLGLFDSELRDYLPARWRPGHFRRILALLGKDPEGKVTNLEATLEQAMQLNRKRSLILIISDFLSPPDEWKRALGQLVAAGHDVRAIQVLDSAEIDLDFGKAAQWEDLETGNRLYIDPAEARNAYKESFQAHQTLVQETLEDRGVTHLVAPTNKPLDFVLLDLLRRKPLEGRVAQ